MLDCYQPFRTTKEHAKELDDDIEKYSVNKAWLIRYYARLGRKLHNARKLRAEAKKDPLSGRRHDLKSLDVRRKCSKA